MADACNARLGGRTARRFGRWRGGAGLVALGAVTVSMASVGSGVGSAGASQKSAKGKALTTVTMELPTRAGVSYVPNYLGIEDGIYKKHGIQLKLETITPTVAVPLILSGGLDFMAATGSAQSSSLRGQAIPTYEVEGKSQFFTLVGAPGITSISQLKGKTIVGESAVSAANTWEITVLKHYGISTTQVSYVNIAGGDAPRIAYVTAGKGAATAVTPVESILMQKEGMKVLSTGNFPATEQAAGGFATSPAFANSHKKLMKNLAAATVEATKIVATTKKKAEKVLESTPYDVAKANVAKLFARLKPTWVTTGKPPQVAITNLLQTLKAEFKLSTTPSESLLFTWKFLPKTKK